MRINAIAAADKRLRTLTGRCRRVGACAVPKGPALRAGRACREQAVERSLIAAGGGTIASARQPVPDMPGGTSSYPRSSAAGLIS